MRNLTSKIDNYYSIYTQHMFTENDFVKMLLVLLFQKGVKRVNEYELKEKLNYYYSNPDFSRLFKEIYRRDMDAKINIENGLYMEKSFTGNVVWDLMKPNVLHLQYDRNVDISNLENKLSNQAFCLIDRLTSELAIRNRIEKYGIHKVIIYGCNPNKNYTLVHGEFNGKILSWELITDGEIKTIDYIKEGILKQHFFDSPVSPACKVQLSENSIARVKIEDASYAIMQGLSNNEIQYSKIFTDICDLDTLKQIRNIANIRHSEETSLLNKRKPYVRKLTLNN